MDYEDKIYEEGYYDFGNTIIFYDSFNQMFYGKNYETQEMLISDKLKHVMLLVKEAR